MTIKVRSDACLPDFFKMPINTTMNDLLLTSAFLKRLLLDQTHIRQSKWRLLLKRAQLRPQIPLFRDRELEIREYFEISKGSLWSLYLSKGVPNTRHFKRYLDTFFEDRTTPDLLKEAYAEAAFFYCLRLMLAFERYSMVLDYLDTLFVLHGKREHSLDSWRVLDYGCGVSDIGLLMALLGSEVTICDLADQKLSFAEGRYRRRGLDVEVVPVSNPKESPPLKKGGYDLVIATEVLEHVFDPLQCLRALTGASRPGGLLFNSMGNSFGRDIGGDHLESAMSIGKSEEYRRYYQAHYVPLCPSEGMHYLFRKVDAQP
jgi:2-polyprenyl-3-methyl-5-hydroxy-6-metoxy-1,4-benzoquinol methylase